MPADTLLAPSSVEGPGRVAAGAAETRLRTLQIGLRWFASGAGGADRVYTDLIRHLPAAGIDSDGIVIGPDDAASRSDGIVRGIGCADASLPRRLLAGRSAIAAATRRTRYDVVASHFGMLTAAGLDRLGGVPLVVHFHGPWADESAAEGQNRIAVAAKRALETLPCRRARRVVTLSEAFRDVAHAQYGVPLDRITVVPGSIDLDRFRIGTPREAARRALGLPEERRLLVAVRRLAHRMGLDRLLAAMPAVIAACPDVLLLIAGRGELASSLRAQADALGLADHVRFLGFVPDDDLPLLYRAADLNLVPTTLLEGFGLTTVEALAAGTPSMVTPVGGLPEIVRPLDPALVFRGTATADLEAGLLDVLRGRIVLPEPAACTAHAGYFSMARMTAGIAAVYREVAAG